MKKMNKILLRLMNKILLGLTMILAVFGAFVIGVIVHEYKHYYDRKDNSDITEICVLNLPYGVENFKEYEKIGYVQYVNPTDSSSSSEFTAGLFGLLITFILSGLVMHYLFSSYYENKFNERFSQEVLSFR